MSTTDGHPWTKAAELPPWPSRDRLSNRFNTAPTDITCSACAMRRGAVESLDEGLADGADPETGPGSRPHALKRWTTCRRCSSGDAAHRQPIHGPQEQENAHDLCIFNCAERGGPWGWPTQWQWTARSLIARGHDPWLGSRYRIAADVFPYSLHGHGPASQPSGLRSSAKLPKQGPKGYSARNRRIRREMRMEIIQMPIADLYLGSFRSVGTWMTFTPQSSTRPVG